MKPGKRSIHLTQHSEPRHHLSFDEYDEWVNPPPESVDFERLVDAELSRRKFLGEAYKGFITVGTGGLLNVIIPADTAGANHTPLKFEPVKANSLDTVTVPEGYHWHVVASWGDPLWSNAAEFDHQSRGTATSQKHAIGDNNDGMELFFIDGRTVMAVNNEYANLAILHGDRDSGLPENEHDYLKNKAAHGISIFEINQ